MRGYKKYIYIQLKEINFVIGHISPLPEKICCLLYITFTNLYT